MANDMKEVSPAVTAVIISLAVVLVLILGWHFVLRPKPIVRPPELEGVNMPPPGSFPIERGKPLGKEFFQPQKGGQ